MGQSRRLPSHDLCSLLQERGLPFDFLLGSSVCSCISHFHFFSLISLGRFRVFRAQLPKENAYIVDREEEDEEEDAPNDEEHASVDLDSFRYLEGHCHICGWAAKKHCAKCKERR